MESIVFVTTNKGKIATLQRVLDEFGLKAIRIDARPLPIIEPQADTCEEVALSKARQAYQLVGEPVLVDDSSFHITALGGFPGVYAKYMNEKLGAEGIIDFMKGKQDRSAHFEGSLVYIDSKGTEHIFNDEPYRGHITDKVHDIVDEAPWSVLYKIFIPEGGSEVLGNRSREKKPGTLQAPDKYALFAQWLHQKTVAVK
jgi:non-canonical purine NTP pyrophosphatase (RdgB/HAM1 family)